MLARIRETIPDAAVTSDFIVGFCGETEADFQQTVALVEESRFKNSFIFKYSAREGTKGAELFADDISDEIKRRRNNELLAIQNAISAEDNQVFLGREVTILVEGPSKTSQKHAAEGHALQLVGRTNCDRIVVFEGNPRQIGQFLPVVIYDANAFTLFGEVVTEHVGPQVYSLSS
jgi:tRNA-2-methylthio-N6-dimethylallyladenosine synthase